MHEFVRGEGCTQIYELGGCSGASECGYYTFWTWITAGGGGMSLGFSSLTRHLQPDGADGMNDITPGVYPSCSTSMSKSWMHTRVQTLAETALLLLGGFLVYLSVDIKYFRVSDLIWNFLVMGESCSSCSDSTHTFQVQTALKQFWCFLISRHSSPPHGIGHVTADRRDSTFCFWEGVQLIWGSEQACNSSNLFLITSMWETNTPLRWPGWPLDRDISQEPNLPQDGCDLRPLNPPQREGLP